VAFNGTSIKVKDYAYFGEVLQNVPVSEAFEEFIIATPLLYQQGITISSNQHSAILLNSTGQQITEAFQGKDSICHYASLVELINFQNTHVSNSLYINSTNEITQANRQAVMYLHSRMGHVPMATMIKNLQSNEWNDPIVNIDMIKSVFKHQDCMYPNQTKFITSCNRKSSAPISTRRFCIYR
jgi:hypothetical protein